MKWTRPSSKPIELKDTPEMHKFALNMGWVKDVKKPAPKKPTKKAE